MITSLRGYRTEDRRALSLREPILTLPASGTLVVPLPGAEEGTARLVRPGDKLAAGQRLSLPRRSAPASAYSPSSLGRQVGADGAACRMTSRRLMQFISAPPSNSLTESVSSMRSRFRQL